MTLRIPGEVAEREWVKHLAWMNPAWAVTTWLKAAVSQNSLIFTRFWYFWVNKGGKCNISSFHLSLSACQCWNGLLLLPLLLTGGFLQRRDADLRSQMSFECRFIYCVLVLPWSHRLVYYFSHTQKSPMSEGLWTYLIEVNLLLHGIVLNCIHIGLCYWS